MAAIRLLKHKGHTDTIAGWARRLGMNPDTLHRRLFNGWTIERALSAPVRPRRELGRVKAKRGQVISPGSMIATMKRNSLAEQRELTRLLRQFSRDFAIIMQRSMGRGVVGNLPADASDRSLSSTQERT
ncbi:hypothetical protein FNL56_16660 [Tardiphaga sp. vice304]|uniref:hypothetical protein n=1 Tax=Tardiphaga sp. vice304 TaxID=2592817 RepID=UPI001162F090|nr:hypothetical protein [Tardiphaga sp. vice304]QDM27571.1 hypothetical protein FNL56_16660 [Tardiphaga sp. vice304]